MRKTLILATTIIFFLAATALAEPTGPGPRPQRGQGKNRARLQQRIELMKMWKLTQALDLNEETAQKLFPVINQFDERERQLRMSRRDLIKQLREELAKETADPDAIRKLVDEVKKNELEMAQSHNQQLDEMSKILNEEQMAKLIVFVPQFERNIKQLMYDVRARRRQKGGSMGGPGNPQQCPLGNQPMRDRRGWDSPEESGDPSDQ